MYFEKSEFVRALAEARIDGVKPTEEEIMVAEVEVLGANDAGPKKRETTSQDKTAMTLLSLAALHLVEELPLLGLVESVEWAALLIC